MADLLTVRTFIENSNSPQNDDFKKRASIALFEVALSTREAQPAGPLTELEVAKQNYALAIMASPSAADTQTQRMIPALAIKANEAGLIDNAGVITATDTQIRNTVSALFDDFSQFIEATA